MREFMIFVCGVVLCAVIGTIAYCGGWLNGVLTSVNHYEQQEHKRYKMTIKEVGDEAEDAEPGKAKPGPSRPTERVSTTVKKPD